ncbi:MAG: O-antigen ligase family protein [Patescibacteria group bacterium]
MKKIDLISFLLVMFLIKIPPFYISPFATKFLTSHVLAKLILGALFIYFILDTKIRTKLNKKVLIFPLLFFLSQSLSLIAARDIYFFLKDYQNIIFSLLILILGFIYGQNKKNKEIIYNFIFTIGILIITLDFVYFLFASQFLSFISIFVQKEALPVYIVNLERGRYNLYLNTELFLPFFIGAFLFTKQNKNKILFSIAIFLIIFLSFVSNFRHRLLFLMFALISYGFLIVKNKNLNVKKILLTFSGIFVIGAISSLLIARVFFQHDIVNRLFLQDEIEDVKSVNSRVDNLNKSIELFKSSPLAGIGLGNYQIYMKDNGKFYIFDPVAKELNSQSISDPHSIVSKTLSETGMTGLISLTIMVLFYLRRDIIYLRENDSQEISAYIISFWGLFILSLITPSITLFRGGWMWFMRGILEGQYQLLGDTSRSSSQ